MKHLLKTVGLSRSTYYYEISKKDKVQERNSELSAEISAIFAENKGRYGVRRVHQALLSRGRQVNHKRVQRIMHQLHLLGKRPKEKYHSYKGEVGKVAANIINRDFSTERVTPEFCVNTTMQCKIERKYFQAGAAPAAPALSTT